MTQSASTPPDVHLVVFKGLPGSGKTTVSRALGKALHWAVVSKDDISVVLDESIADYGALAHKLMWRIVTRLLEQGFDVIRDTTLIAPYSYADAAQVANDTAAKLIVIECRCSDSTIWRQRIEARQGLPARYLSEWSTFQQYALSVGATTNYPIPSPYWIVDTVEPLGEIIAGLRQRLTPSANS